MLPKQLQQVFPRLKYFILMFIIYLLALPAGHLVNVTLLYSEPLPAPGPRAKVAAPKKGRITKLDNIVLEATTRVDFIKAFFRTHNVDDKYSPGVHSGPDFKFWWSGSR